MSIAETGEGDVMPGWVRMGLATAVFSVAACGGGDSPPTSPSGTVIMLTTDARFSPADITIDPGTTVRWQAASSEMHTITPDSPLQSGVWSRVVSTTTGTVLTHTFNVSGQTYTYHCEPHLSLGMTGTIRVR